MVNMMIYGCWLKTFMQCSVLLSLFTSGSITAWAYEEMVVSNGGTVTGTVQFSGELPQPTSFELRRYPDQDYCGALSDGSGYLVLREVAAGPEHGLKDVIVTIQGIGKGKPFEFEETALESKVCQFVPFVSVMRDQHPITVKNLDSAQMEFESVSLRVEKVIGGNGQATIRIRPLGPGRYEFYDDFNPQAGGVLVVR